jgi:hypothetical protein
MRRQTLIFLSLAFSQNIYGELREDFASQPAAYLKNPK